MAPFRSEGDLVAAFNSTRDLTNLVVAYLLLWRKYANHTNGITVPDGPFTVVFVGLRPHGIDVKIIYTVTHTYENPVYYDVDDGNFSESRGSSNLSHYNTTFNPQLCEAGITIPFAALLRSESDMEFDIRKYAGEKNKLRKA